MKPALVQKLEKMVERREEIARELSTPEVLANSDRFRRLSQEYAQLGPLTETFGAYQSALKEIGELEQLRGDAELKSIAEAELPGQIASRDGARQEELEAELQGFLVPKDPLDGNNVFLEIRAGTGGDEAALFAGDLFRMYSRYAETRRAGRSKCCPRKPGSEHGGYKEVIARLAGYGAYSRLKFESGAHRVQRVPATEAQGRIHTSAATVAVLPEIEAAQAVEINPADLKIDTYRASGAGGQHVNKTESAIRITHIPSGLVVECQDERSQHKNRARAMSLLSSRLLDAEREKAGKDQQAATRKKLVGSGDRSERIRTYNFGQGRVTDHRINLTLYQLDDVMNGNRRRADWCVEPGIPGR